MSVLRLLFLFGFSSSKAQKCLCGARNCRGFIGEKKSKETEEKESDVESNFLFVGVVTPPLSQYPSALLIVEEGEDSDDETDEIQPLGEISGLDDIADVEPFIKKMLQVNKLNPIHRMLHQLMVFHNPFLLILFISSRQQGSLNYSYFSFFLSLFYFYFLAND